MFIVTFSRYCTHDMYNCISLDMETEKKTSVFCNCTSFLADICASLSCVLGKAASSCSFLVQHRPRSAQTESSHSF